MRVLPLCLLVLSSSALAACAASGAGGREVNITQTEDGCVPTAIEATPGEKLNLMVKNESGKDYEIEGTDGTKLEELVVPEGRRRSVGYDVPGAGGIFKLKCYVPGGVNTIIEVRAAGSSGSPTTPSGQTSDPQTPVTSAGADTTVRVALDEFTVTPDAAIVAAGKIEFLAENVGHDVHELYVLRPRDNGFDVLGEIEHLDPGASDSMVLELTPGEYTLACLIAPGEAGSTVDHFKEGMHTEFTVR